jgi:hypothetical protein
VLQNWYTSYRDHQLAQAKALISQLKQQATAQVRAGWGSWAVSAPGCCRCLLVQVERIKSKCASAPPAVQPHASLNPTQ